jgi:hypothetical protein
VVVLMDVRGTGFQVGVLFLPSANNQHCYPYFFCVSHFFRIMYILAASRVGAHCAGVTVTLSGRVIWK